MQADGNVVLYEPDGKRGNVAIWASGVRSGGGPQYSLNMQDDGNLVAYEGTKAIWATNTPWSVSSIQMSNVVYDTANARIASPQLVGEFESALTNGTTVTQTQTFQFEIDYTEQHSWSVTASIKAGIQAQLSGGIPQIVNGQVQESGEVSASFTIGGQYTTLKKYADSIPVTVPASATVRCLATVSVVQVSIPYAANHVLFNLADGRQLVGMLKGQYQGTLGYQLQTTFTQI